MHEQDSGIVALRAREYAVEMFNMALVALESFDQMGFCVRNRKVSSEQAGEDVVFVVEGTRRFNQRMTLTIRVSRSKFGKTNAIVKVCEESVKVGIGPSEINVACYLGDTDRCEVTPTIGEPSKEFLEIAITVGVQDDSYLGMGDRITDCPVHPTGARNRLRHLAQAIEEHTRPFFP